MSRVSAGTSMKCNCGAEMRLRDGKYGQFWGCSTFPKCRQTKRYNGTVEVQETLEDFDPSPYQLAFKIEIETGTGHIVLEARPGSGKTVSSVWASQFTPKDDLVAFLAFNKKIATTFARKVAPHVHASTLHSLGYGNIRNALGNTVKFEGRKVYYIIRDLMDAMPFEQMEIVEQNIPTVTRLVSMCKGLLVDPTIDNMVYIVDRWNIETNGDRELLFDVAAQAFRLSVEQDATIDYDDMIYYCAIGKVPCQTFDVLFIDETQDLNAANLEMAVRSITKNGRIIAVGDPHQSIYGFRGADTEAMPNIIKRLQAKVLPLSISYRCPKSHVELANSIFPGMEAAEWAEDGIIEDISDYAFHNTVKPGDLVLCRTNAPLVKPAFSLIRQGVKAVILGRDIGVGLMNLVKKIQKRQRVSGLDDTLAALDEYARIEYARLLKRDRAMSAELLMDKIETIHALCDGCYTIGDLERRIETVFADDAVGVTFSTIHKAKGGEADNVFILRADLMPHPKATAAWEMEQEYNIQYVAFTRAKKALYFVGGGAPFTTEGDQPSPEEPKPYFTDEPAFTDGPFNETPVAVIAETLDAEDYAGAQEVSIAETYNVLDDFPTEGRFESNIYRPSAWDFANAMPEWSHAIDSGQLVMEKDLGTGSMIRVYTSVKVGQIAGGVGDDSIRVVRLDTRERDGRVFPFKNSQDWVTREVPKSCKNPESATVHLVGKIQKQIDAFTRNCPECDGLQVKCRAGKGRDSRVWWRGLDCEHSTW